MWWKQDSEIHNHIFFLQSRYPVPVPRLMLHAERLSLPHPNGGALTLTAPPPDVFPNLVAALGLDLAALKLV